MSDVQNKKPDHRVLITTIVVAVIGLIGTVLAALIGIVPDLIHGADNGPTTIAVASTPTPSPASMSPTEFVIAYWKNISDGRYQTAWNSLSLDFQIKNHDGNYANYSKGFEGYCGVDATHVKLIEQTEAVAQVSTHVTYQMAQLDCHPVTYEMLIRLIYDRQHSTWSCDSTEILAKVP